MSAGKCPFFVANAEPRETSHDSHDTKKSKKGYLEESYSNGFWEVGPQHGFMPKSAPLERLPERYASLQALTDNMSIVKRDGSAGYLATSGAIRVPTESQPDIFELVKKEEDVFVLAALYRALTFVTAAYLLEPAHQKQVETGEYGKALTFLPRVISQPLVHVSEKLGVFPWLDYHYAYSLGNHIRINPQEDYKWQNLKMACAFSGKTDECGFIMLHVDIVSHSPNLLASIWEFAKNPNVASLRKNYETMLIINERRKQMWQASDWRRYNDFRVFIMGVKGNNALFGDGVVYDGCFNNEPHAYRGQSGSQDDIIPTEDIFTGVLSYYPDNTLTQYLLDMRAYRPPEVREFFRDLEGCNFRLETFEQLGVEALVLLLAIVDQIYVFRNGHWMFVQKYILSTTKYEMATGGTPITTWLPNQIDAVLRYQADIVKHIEALGSSTDPLYVQLRDNVPVKHNVLRQQEEELKKGSGNYDPDRVHGFNTGFEYDRVQDQLKHANASGASH